MKNPGRAGLTVDRLGDSEKWGPKTQNIESQAKSHDIAGKNLEPSTAV